MNVADFEKLYTINSGFIKPVMESLGKIDWDRAVKENICGWGSLRNLVAHTFEAQDHWFTWYFIGKEFKGYEYDNFPDIPSLEKKWREVSKRSLEIIRNLNDDDLEKTRSAEIRGQRLSFKTGEILLHVYTHEVHHRGQIVMAVRQLGGEPEDVDIL